MKPMPAKIGQEIVYQLKVGLLETDPIIWRRFVIPARVTLHRLHLVLQVVMGWKNYHLYRFQLRASEYGEPDPENEFFELDFNNSKRMKLRNLMTPKGSLLLYEYDFGDSWEHEVLLEDILEAEPDQHYPLCLAGERACPPEDCGGPSRYAEMLEIIGNPEHEEYEDYMTWLGGRFDPNQFDAEAVNRRLSSMRLRQPS